MGAAIWTFLNSGLFQGLAIWTIGLIWKKTNTTKARQEQLTHYADDLFNVVEVMGKETGMTGVQKWTKFMQEMTNHLAAEKKPALTGPEVAQLQNLAFRKSWLKKSADKGVAVIMKKE